MNSPSRYAWAAFATFLVAFHLALIFYGLAPNLVSRPVHMAFALPFVLILGARTRSGLLSGIVLTAIGIPCCLWIAANYVSLGDQYGFIENNFQLTLGIVLLVIVLEMARRSIGWPLPVVAFIALLYGLLGQHIPGEFGHPGTPLSSFLGTLTIAEGGIWGELTGVSVSIVAIFVIFGAVLNAGEAGQGFMNLAAAAAGRLKGGAAKISVIASALFGSISGSASANVASTGTVTLPAMIRLGYPKRLSAAVEAVASSGGQVMPPIMGAGAFVMVELTGTPYTGIIAAAFLPALLYFFAVWVGINAFANRWDLKPVPREEKPDSRTVMLTSCFFIVPFSLLMWGMFGVGYTPQYSACLSILAAAMMLLVDARLTFDSARTLARFTDALISAGRQVAMIASIILCASIVIGVLSITGLGVKITSVILTISGGLLWPSLFLTALACLFLGMEVPTTAAYVICVSVAGPVLVELGVDVVQAHLFVFWFALLSTITPPVCGAVFIAAGMVDESWLKVAATSMALGIGLYLIPFAMVANPALTAPGLMPVVTLLSVAKSAGGLFLVSQGIIARRRWLWRGLLIGAGLVMLFVPLQTNFQ